MQEAQPGLKRKITLPLLTFYGLGTIIGAGIYVLVGKVAGYAGLFAPISFVLAAIISAFSAFSFAELAARYPYSAGMALYVQKGFRLNWLSIIVGWLVILTGVISCATLANGFVGYFQIFLPIPSWTIIVAMVFVIGIVVIWGIQESTIVAAITTIIEIGGLVFVIFVAAKSLHYLPGKWLELIPPLQGKVWIGIFLGSFIAFFAFIGYEDMVVVAEEVQNTRRNMPIAITLAIIISTVLYFIIMIVALLAVPVAELGKSVAPLALVVEKSNASLVSIISFVGLVAIVNGVLIQMIMASRVIYGMAATNKAPRLFAKINAKTHTPIHASVLVIITVLILALWFPLVKLAEATTFFMLLVFTLVNMSLILVKIREPKMEGVVSYPIFIPIVGAILCLSLLVFEIVVYF